MCRTAKAFLIFLALAPLAQKEVSGQGKPGVPRDELILCGWDEVFILEPGTARESSPVKVWTWKAAGCEDLPDSMKSRFNTTDECKPVDHGTKLLITSSGGGVALVERKTGGVLFYGTADNVHSGDLLPGGRLVVAASHKPGGRGDRLIVFGLDLPGKELCSAELPWGHGAVWDSTRQVLWALADKEIRAFRLENWDSPHPSLLQVTALELPEAGGHDLYPVAGTGLLTLSTAGRCWVFDRDRRSLSPHPDLAEKRNVKSISVNPVTGQLAWVEAEGSDWWAERVHFLRPDYTLHLPGEHLYKARWSPQSK